MFSCCMAQGSMYRHMFSCCMAPGSMYSQGHIIEEWMVVLIYGQCIYWTQYGCFHRMNVSAQFVFTDFIICTVNICCVGGWGWFVLHWIIEYTGWMNAYITGGCASALNVGPCQRPVRWAAGPMCHACNTNVRQFLWVWCLCCGFCCFCWYMMYRKSYNEYTMHAWSVIV